MPVNFVVLIFLVIMESSGCPTWYYINKNGECQCGSELNGRIICHEWNKTVEISAGFCITFIENSTVDDKTSLIVGDCAYGYSANMTNRRYSVLLQNVSTEINDRQCKPYNRQGIFCGQCIDGFGPAVYSFNLQCSNCSNKSTMAAICLYALIDLLPIAIFFFVVLIFRLNLMRGPLIGYVVFCQSVINTLQYSKYIYASLISNLSQPLAVLAHGGLVLSGIWNLDFFKFISSPFCISEKLTNLQVHMLGFLTSLYPILLVLLTYLAIEINARYGLIKTCIKGKKYCNTSRNVKHSIIHAFATFTMLSIFSTMCKGYAVLQTSTVLDMNGSVVRSVLYCYPSMVMFSSKHLPYLFISLTLVFLLVVCPALFLFIYPTRLYGKFACYLLSARKQLAIKIFVETVYSDIKDGLNNTRDYRMIPSFIIFLALAFSLFMSILPHYGFDGFPPFSIGVIFALAAFLVSYLRPCKTVLTNMSLSFHLLIIGIMSLLCGLWWQDLMLNSDILAITVVVFSIIPHALMITWVVHTMLQKYSCYSHVARAAITVVNMAYATCKCKTNDYSTLHEVVMEDEESVQ